MADPFDRAFAALEPRERNSLRAISIARSYDRGEALFHQGDDPGALHVIMRGRVKVSAVTDDGREALFSLAGPGDLVGEISALAGRQRTATVRALEPVSSLAITGDALRAAVSGSSRLAIFFLEIAADRLQVVRSPAPGVRRPRCARARRAAPELARAGVGAARPRRDHARRVPQSRGACRLDRRIAGGGEPRPASAAGGRMPAVRATPDDRHRSRCAAPLRGCFRTRPLGRSNMERYKRSTRCRLRSIRSLSPVDEFRPRRARASRGCSVAGYEGSRTQCCGSATVADWLCRRTQPARD